MRVYRCIRGKEIIEMLNGKENNQKENLVVFLGHAELLKKRGKKIGRKKYESGNISIVAYDIPKCLFEEWNMDYSLDIEKDIKIPVPSYIPNTDITKYLVDIFSSYTEKEIWYQNDIFGLKCKRKSISHVYDDYIRILSRNSDLEEIRNMLKTINFMKLMNVLVKNGNLISKY